MSSSFVTRGDATAAPSVYALYQYTPSLSLAIVSSALFLCVSVLHIICISKLHAKMFIPFALGCLMEAVGYGGRIWSHFDTNSIAAFIIQSLLILISPALFAASIYMALGRLIALVEGERFSVIPLRWLTKLFVTGDCVSFFVQICGGGIQAGGSLDLVHLGEKIIVVGLFIQLVFFGLFLTSAAVFNKRIRAEPTSKSLSEDIPWQKTLWTLYITSIIILVRSVFRVVEYIMGNTGWILQHEFMLYSLDTALMFIVAIIFLLWHPSKMLFHLRKKTEVEFQMLQDSS